MKKIAFEAASSCLITLLFTGVFCAKVNAQQTGVGIGTINVDSSSVLHLHSTDKGLLTPRMTTIQRTAISNPATGLLVFDTDTESFWFYDGSAWDALVSQTTDSDQQTLVFNNPNLSLSLIHI